MEEAQARTGKISWTYGLLAGAIGIVFTLMLMYIDMLYDQSIGKTIMGIVILIAVVVLAIFNFKKENNGFLTLRESLKVGVGTALVAAIISVVFTYLLTNFMVPDFWEKTAEISRVTLKEQNPRLTAEQLENAIEMQGKFAWITYPAILIFNLFVGLVTSLLAGLVLKKTDTLN